MAKIRFTSIKPGLVFEHEGVKLKAVEVQRINNCKGCFFDDKDAYCSIYPCLESRFGKQKHELIFQNIEND